MAWYGVPLVGAYTADYLQNGLFWAQFLDICRQRFLFLEPDTYTDATIDAIDDALALLTNSNPAGQKAGTFLAPNDQGAFVTHRVPISWIQRQLKDCLNDLYKWDEIVDNASSPTSDRVEIYRLDLQANWSSVAGWLNDILEAAGVDTDDYFDDTLSQFHWTRVTHDASGVDVVTASTGPAVEGDLFTRTLVNQMYAVAKLIQDSCAESKSFDSDIDPTDNPPSSDSDTEGETCAEAKSNFNSAWDGSWGTWSPTFYQFPVAHALITAPTYMGLDGGGNAIYGFEINGFRRRERITLTGLPEHTDATYHIKTTATARYTEVISQNTHTYDYAVTEFADIDGIGDGNGGDLQENTLCLTNVHEHVPTSDEYTSGYFADYNSDPAQYIDCSDINYDPDTLQTDNESALAHYNYTLATHAFIKRTINDPNRL